MTNRPQDDDTPRHQRLDAELDHLRGQLATLNTPPQVAANLQRVFARSQARQAAWPANVGRWFAPVAAIAASVSMSLWLLLAGAPAGDVASRTNSAAFDSAAPFVALQSLEQIALEPNPRLIETQIPKMMLAAMGVAMPPELAGETVRTEMLVSAAGQPLALRFRPQ
jgi:hypothetical protein